jgi:short-chain fatty acids transporter
MRNRLVRPLLGVVERWMPDPFLFCALLTAVCFLLAAWLTPTAPLALVQQWYDGLWQILSFSMQMVLILLAGYTLARSEPARRALTRVALLPRTQGSAIVVVTLTAMMLALVNWGVALVAAALLAREIARRVPNCDYGFLVAGAYSGFVIWGSGLSSSIALVCATPGNPLNFIARYTGVASTPLSETLFAPFNLALVAGMLVGMPLLFLWMMPQGSQIRRLSPAALIVTEPELAGAESAETDATPAARLERSRILLGLIVAPAWIYLVWHFATNGFRLDLNIVILLFLAAGMMLHGRPATYLRAFNESARVAGPLLLQYPLYGGIMGIMQQSGLGEIISRWFVSFSTPETFPVYTFYSALLVNLFVPSGGGQWAVQGPVMIPAGIELGVSPAVTAMAVAFGDQGSNMLQPFWALPALAVAGLRIRDIMGYCVMTFLLSTLLSTLVLLVLA